MSDVTGIKISELPAASSVARNAIVPIVTPTLDTEAGTVAQIIEDVSASDVLATGSDAPRALETRFAEFNNVLDWGAVGNGIADDTVPIQNLIDAVNAAGGGTIHFPPGNYLGNWILKENVRLVGAPYANKRSNGPVILTGKLTGAVIDTPVGATVGMAVVGFNFAGLGSGTALIGVHFRNVSDSTVEWCFFNNFADQAIKHDAGLACKFSDIKAQNCLLNRTRGAQDGVIYLGSATDNFLERIESTASVVTNKTAGGQCNAFHIGGANHFLISCIGEISDSGFYINSTYNRFVNCRADLNMMEGYHLAGGANQLSNCIGLSNSQDTTNTYSDFYVEVTVAQKNGFSNCLSDSLTAKVPKYGFEDYTAYAAVTARSVYDSTCRALNYGTAAFLVQTGFGAGVVVPPVYKDDAQTGTVTVDVTGTTMIVLSAGSAEEITNFTGGVSGQSIKLKGNANVTIKHNTTIKTNTGADKTLAADKVYTFTLFGTVWIENA